VTDILEIWKDIKLGEDFQTCEYFQVSNLGRIKSLDRYVNVRNGFKSFKKGLIRKTVISRGYELVLIRGCSFSVHRLVANAFIDKPKDFDIIDYEVNHIDFNRSNNVSSNLEWLTKSQNAQYTVNAGRGQVGEQQHHSVLKVEDVLSIRKLLKEGLTQRAIGKQFGVGQYAIWCIANNTQWKHVK